jgi:hypothetical protein
LDHVKQWLNSFRVFRVFRGDLILSSTKRANHQSVAMVEGLGFQHGKLALRIVLVLKQRLGSERERKRMRMSNVQALVTKE